MTDPPLRDSDSPDPDLPGPESAAPPPPPAEAAPARRGFWRRRWKLVVAGVLLAPVLFFACFTVMTLTWSYSEGQRSGVLQKLSRRGWICKTWEGELAMTTQPGVAPVIWSFSVRNEAAVRQLSTAIGRPLVLYYQEHQGIPTTCFGDTRYFVDSLRLVRR